MNGRPADLTASGISRAAACPASYALPATWEPSSPQAARGKAIHAFLEGLQTALPSGDPAAYQALLAEAPADLREQLDALELGEFPLGEAETVFAVDVVTGTARALGHIKGRAYPKLGPNEISGTADLATRRAEVLDWKAGNIDYVEPAAESHQLGFHAFAISRVHSVDSVRVAIAHVDLDRAQITYDWHEHDAMALDAIGEDLRAIHGGVIAARESVRNGVVPAVNPGPYCKWCPAAKACPAMAADAAALATVAESTWMARVRTDLAEPGGVEKWHRRLPIMESIIDAIKSEVRSIVIAGPVEFADGSTLSIETRTRKSIDAKVIAAELANAVGPDEAARITAGATKSSSYATMVERKAAKGRAA